MRGALLVLVCACHGTPKPAAPEQTKQQALALLCEASGTPERVTNKEMRRVVDGFAGEHPWEIEKQILQVARESGLTDCHPLDALTNIRAPNGVDVPVLADDRNTVPVDPGRTFAITPTGITIEDAGTLHVDQLDDLRKYTPLIDGPVAARFAIDRAVDVHRFAPIYDALRRAGVGDIELLVTTPTRTRAVVVVAPKARSSEAIETTAVLEVGDAIALGGKVMTPDELRAKLATPPDHVVIVPEPGVTMQRLAEIIAMTGGRATLGRAALPVVEPAPR